MRVAILLCCLSVAAQAQSRIIGEVTGKDSTGKQITIRDDSGKAITVVLDEKTSFLRVAPGETNLANAGKITLSDVAAGDRVLVSIPSADTPALRVVVMAKSEIEKKRAAEREDWQTRGLAGTITGIDPSTKKITVDSRSTGQLIIEPSERTQFRRYAPDSVRFADAQPSSFEALKTGDQVRVLGDREGDKVSAAVLVSGTFRNVAGTVVSVNPAEREIQIMNLETKQRLTVKAGEDSMLRRMPPRAAEMLARRNTGNTGERRRSHEAGGRDMQMMERMPVLALAELKAGDAVIVASTEGNEPSRVTAIAVIAGVEPLLTDRSRESDSRLGGSWNFDIDIAP